RLHTQSKFRYGSPKLTALLRQDGIVISERTVTRYMKEMGIRSITAKKYKATTNSKHNLPVYPNLLNQNFTVRGRGEVWVSDITYVHTKAGWLYLATVMDLFSRRVIGWAMSDRMTQALVIQALKRAFQTQSPTAGLIHHSDRGSQYAALDYQALLREHDITTSMSRKGNCYDNFPQHYQERTDSFCALSDTRYHQPTHRISIHAPTWGATLPFIAGHGSRVLFQSTHPHGVRLSSMSNLLLSVRISIHAPTWGATGHAGTGCDHRGISIHAPTWGATMITLLTTAAVLLFQSTHPHG